MFYPELKFIQGLYGSFETKIKEVSFDVPKDGVMLGLLKTKKEPKILFSIHRSHHYKAICP